MKVNYWETDNEAPVLSFIQGEPVKAGAKIQKIIDYFEEQGLSLLNTQYLKKIQGHRELYELRIIWSGIKYRILLVIRDSIAWLVHAFIKTSKKIPLHHLQLADQRRMMIQNLSVIN